MSIDHRRLGRELGLFASDQLLGAGLPLWLPAGSAIRSEIERFVLELERRAGYQHVHTPPLAKRELYEKSGHWEHFADDMFPPIDMGDDDLVLRPMNCPHHIRVFAAGQYSHRDLPVRIAELGAMFRRERSGVLGGLSRVRGMTLNDGHVFCRGDQVGDELLAVIDLIGRALEVLGVEVDHYRLSLRGDGGKYVDNEEAWAFAEAALREALDARGVPFVAVEGEAAFYGPKLDVQVVDAGGREQTLATMQVDVVLPQRLDISYVDGDGRRVAPVVIHRSLVSTMERMVAYLIERYEGALPLWLSPTQVAVLPVSEPVESVARAVHAELVEADIRASLFDARHTLSSRIRNASRHRVPYIAVIGGQEAEAGTVAVRARDGEEWSVAVDEFVRSVLAESGERRR